MRRQISEPAVGNKYWWLPGNVKEPITMVVTAVDDQSITLAMTMNRYIGGTYDQTVEWTRREWDSAKSQVNDWLPAVTEDMLEDGERLCGVCSGSRWEMSKDLEIEPCMWCGFEGKVKTTRSENSQPKKTRRSPLHPELG